MWRADLRHAWRVLSSAPGVTGAVVVALSLGLAANTVVFSIVNAAMFRRLPYADPAALVMVAERSSRAAEIAVAYPDYLDWARDATAFESLGAANHETFNLTGMGDPVQVFGLNISASMFDVLGVRPLVGRVIRGEDDRPSSDPVVVLSYASWVRRFGGDPAAVGRRIVLDGIARTIVGVMPAGFRYPVSDEAGEIFSPLGRLAKDLNSRAVHPGLFVVGRLKRGVTLDQARADVDRIATSLARSYPATNRDIRSRTDFYAKRAAESSRTLLVALWGAVTAVLLVACASAAALLGARGAARAREFAIRIALGATRVHLLRQLLTESVLLALASGAGGLLLAWRALPAIAARLPTTIPRTADIGIDGGVLAFATALTLATGLIAGVIPAWQAGRSALPRTAGSRIEARASNRRARGLLVVGQLALSQVLLIGAGLLLATLAHLLRVDPGFRSDHLATALYYLPDAVYVTHDRVVGFHEAALARTAALPGVSGSGLVSPPPFGFGSSSADVTVDNDLEPIKTDTFVVSPDALTVLGVPLRSGRFFDTRDRQGAPRVALVDDWFASRYLGPHPLGRRIRLDRSAPAEVVGIVGHIAERSLDYEGRPQVYSPFFAESRHFAQIVVRTPDTDPMARMADIRKAVSALDPDLPLFGAASMDALIAATADSARLGAAVFGAFAATAWLLAAIGLAGVVGYSVTTRTREIGIRLALGARPGGLVRDVVGYGGGLTLAGLALGIAAGMVCARTMSALLVGVAPADPSVIVLSAIALLVTGIAASYLPARRISRVDPVDALRSE